MSSSRVMVIDDDPAIRAALAEWLALVGYTPAMFADGTEALAAVRADPPDLIILDYMMVPMDGLAVLAALRAEPHLRSIPVLLLTGFLDDIPSLPQDVATMRKPFRLEALAETVRSLLARGAAR